MYAYHVDDRGFYLDTKELRKILGEFSFHIEEVSDFIKKYLIEQKKVTDDGIEF